MAYDIFNEEAKVKIVYLASYKVYSPLLDFYQQVQALKNVATIIVWHRYGYGDSEIIEGPRQFSYICDELNFLLNSLNIKENIILVGHNFGAALCLEYAKHYLEGIKSIILLNPSDKLNDNNALTSKMSEDVIKAKLLLNNKAPKKILGEAYQIFLRQEGNSCIINEMSNAKSIPRAYDSDLEKINHLSCYIICPKSSEKFAIDFVNKFQNGTVEILAYETDYVHYTYPYIVTKSILKAIKEIN